MRFTIMKERFCSISERALLAGSAVALAAAIQFGTDARPGFAIGLDTATATSTATGTPTPTKTSTPNSIATRIAAEQTKVADLQAQVGGLRNLKAELDNLKKLQQESTSLQNQIDDTNKVIDLQAQRDALVVSSKLKQEITVLQDEIDALNGTPTRTPTPTSTSTPTLTPTPTATLTEFQKKIKQDAGLLPPDTATPKPAVITTPTPANALGVGGSGGGFESPNIPNGDKILMGGGILAVVYALRRRIPIVRRIGNRIPGPHI